MAKDIFWTSVTFAIIIAILVAAFWPVDKSQVIVIKYDCGLVNADLNMPATVKEECRKRELK
jgi:hypothetical protein